MYTGTDSRYTDIHIHALFGVDDGARTPEEMFGIVERAYRAGTRYMVLTPHFHPGYYGDNIAAAREAFRTLEEHCRVAYPDLHLYRGNELHYQKGCRSWVDTGACLTVAGSNYLLVDFSEYDSADLIFDGLHRLLNGGYLPILAHAEKYRALRGKYKAIGLLRQSGILIQMDAASVLGESGWSVKRFSRGLLKRKMVDIVSSDAHRTDTRLWRMDECGAWIGSNCSPEYAKALLYDNARIILESKTAEVISNG